MQKEINNNISVVALMCALVCGFTASVVCAHTNNMIYTSIFVALTVISLAHVEQDKVPGEGEWYILVLLLCVSALVAFFAAFTALQHESYAFFPLLFSFYFFCVAIYKTQSYATKWEQVALYGAAGNILFYLGLL